jgi:hypothetical protein
MFELDKNNDYRCLVNIKYEKPTSFLSGFDEFEKKNQKKVQDKGKDMGLSKMDLEIKKLSKQYKGLLHELGLNYNVEDELRNPESDKSDHI